jgi:hypothetical protein
MGLIHRDISPENIMLSQDHHGKLLVKVIDFGIAKQLAEGEGGQGLTQTGMFLGKLKYASPEQAGYLKEGEHLDARSDLYSFGIVLYEMLAGRAPFQATNPHGYILKHVTEKPLPITQLNPDVAVPPQLEEIVQRSLEKNRDQRYASAADFATALESIRGSITPDAKYGLGERMVTLGVQRTVQDLPKPRTGQQPTMGSSRTQAEQPTVIERGTMSSQPTVVERARTASNEPTVVERISSQSAPTVAESKWQGEAQPTVLERQFAPKKNNIGMFSAIAAAVIIAILATIIVMRPKAPAAGGATTTVAGSTVEVTNTTGTTPPAPGKGALLLSASPWGDIDKIVNEKNNAPVDLSDEKKSTPTRIDLAPGKYLVTLTGPNGKTTFGVQIDAGQKVPKAIDLGGVNLDELEKEVTKQ